MSVECDECGGTMVPTGDFALVTPLPGNNEAVWIFYRYIDGVAVYVFAERRSDGVKRPISMSEAVMLSRADLVPRDDGFWVEAT